MNKDLYDVALAVTDEVMGKGTYAEVNKNHPNPGVQAAITRAEVKGREFETPRIAKLPVNENGYRVPWFVCWIDGKPDFRIIRPGGPVIAHRDGLCWICGEKMGAYKTFVIGPMCAINRVSAEPPMHKDCAIYSVKACPFMTRPDMRRRPVDENVGTQDAAGTMIERNPGVSLLWTTKRYEMFKVPPGHGQEGYLFEIGDPVGVEWYTEGRPSTREEVLTSIKSGYPLLEEMARKEGLSALDALERQTRDAMRLLPT